jgi:AcrR family transcriptional regulator
MSSKISLRDRHTVATRDLILDIAVELLERSGVIDLTIRAVAKEAGMSERTVFRYFATRDEFLDAVAERVATRLHPPEPPQSIAELLAFPGPLYRSFEKRAQLVEATLHTEVFKRVRAGVANERWAAVAEIMKEAAPHRSKKERAIAATNINYFLSGTTWHYYRSSFELSLDDTIACAMSAIKLIVDDLKRKKKS